VIGLEAKSLGKDDPDVIQRAQPVPDCVAVKSRIDNLIGQLVEPLLMGVEVVPVPESAGSTTGFVIVNIPPCDGLPCRSRKDWKFYQRISTGTFPLEYFQIADLFGKRRRPVLKLYIEDLNDISQTGMFPNIIADRMFVIGIENCGRGTAKFPSLKMENVPGLNVDQWGIDGNGGFGLPRVPTDQTKLVFGGGADHVIYPGTILKIAKLGQRERRLDGYRVFIEYSIAAELAADECPLSTDVKVLPEKKFPL
jgi:hypothetical protein